MDKSPAQTQTPEEVLKAAIEAAATPADDIADTAMKLDATLQTQDDKRKAELAKGRAMADRYAKAPPYIHRPETDEPASLDMNQPMENLLAGVRSRADLIQIFEAHKHDVPAPYAPPPMAPKQAARINAEMEKGAAAVARRTAELKRDFPGRAVPSAVELKAQGSTSKVARPGDHVPKMNQGYVQGRK